MLRKIVFTLIVVLCAAAAVAPANAQSVNINVDASKTVAAQPPRSFVFEKMIPRLVSSIPVRPPRAWLLTADEPQ